MNKRRRQVSCILYATVFVALFTGEVVVPASAAPPSARSCHRLVVWKTATSIATISSVRGMTCGATKRDFSHPGGCCASNFTTASGFRCRSHYYNASIVGRCSKGSRVYRFGTSA